MNSLFKPRYIEFIGRSLPLFTDGKPAYKVVIADNANPLTEEAARIVCRGIGYPDSAIVTESKAGKGQGIFLCTPEGPSRFCKLLDGSRIAKVPKNREQAYEIKTLGEDIILLGFTPQALIHGARTLIEQVKDNKIPELSVYDYPDLAYRGIYCECRWGTDDMSLDEWKEAIDILSSMRMNVVSIGIYNNWPIQYDGKISEWLLVPIKKYPKLKTPKIVNYYSPSQKRDIHLEYVPRMYEEDLFGEIIKYGKSKGVLVRPHFNTPGHNTQIPRHYPETSAKFADGTLKKYGFCMSSPATYEVMFDIFDEICDRYLLPNGIDWFHIGLDEVYPLVGMNEDMPMKSINPWCECPECAKSSPEDHFVNYAVRMAKHLKEKGINNIGMWHDHFARGGKMNEELSRRFEEEGLKENVVLHWWRYADFFDTTMPELGFRRWVVPMTGYFYWINYQNHLANCFLAAEKGVEENAEGTEAYGLWHPSYHQHFAMLASKSWNSDNLPTVGSFREEYAKQMFGDRWREGMRAFNYFDDITAGPGMMNFMSKLFAYPYLYANWKEDAYFRENYPRPIVSQLADNAFNITGFFTQISGYVQKAIDIFSRDGLWANMECDGLTSLCPSSENKAASSRRTPKDIHIAECMRMKAVLDLFPVMANSVRAVRNGVDAAKLNDWADSIDKAVEYLDSAMLMIENTWDPPHIPQTLRELTLMRTFAIDLAAELRTGPKGKLKVMECKPIDWPND